MHQYIVSLSVHFWREAEVFLLTIFTKACLLTGNLVGASKTRLLFFPREKQGKLLGRGHHLGFPKKLAEWVKGFYFQGSLG